MIQWKQILGIDLRTLALFRILLAITLFFDVAGIWPIAFPLFDDRGLYPRDEVLSAQGLTAWSLFFINGHVLWAYILLSVLVLMALALLVGYRTRLVTVICWILLCSLSTRISIFGAGDDVQFQILFFWAMFLPLGARFSVDAALSKRPKGANLYASPATLGLMLQVAYIYFFGALIKTSPAWNNGTIIYYVMHAADLNTWFSSYLAPHTELMWGLTRATWYLEFIAIFFLFSPIKTVWTRLIILPPLIALHIGIGTFMRIPWFPLVCITGLMTFIPSIVWDRFLPWFNARPKRRNITIYYDKDCGFCRKTCAIFRELGLPPETPIKPAQDYPDIYTIMQRENSWVVETGTGMRLTKWEAVAWCWRRSPILWPLGYGFMLPGIKQLGAGFYLFIATYRPQLAKLSSRFLEEHEKNLEFKPHTITQYGLGVCVLLMMLWGINAKGRVFGEWPRPIAVFMKVTKLSKNWGLFLGPRRESIWPIIEGYLEDGTIVNLFHQTMIPPSHERPANAYEIYSQFRWHKFFNRTDSKAKRDKLGKYFCSVWRDFKPADAPPLEYMTYTLYAQKTPAPGVKTSAMPITVKESFEYDCDKRDGQNMSSPDDEENDDD